MILFSVDFLDSDVHWFPPFPCWECLFICSGILSNEAQVILSVCPYSLTNSLFVLKGNIYYGNTIQKS